MGINRNCTKNDLKFFTNLKRNLTGLYDMTLSSCSPKVYNTKPVNPLRECGKLGGNLIIFYLQKESIWQYFSSSIQSQI